MTENVLAFQKWLPLCIFLFFSPFGDSSKFVKRERDSQSKICTMFSFGL